MVLQASVCACMLRVRTSQDRGTTCSVRQRMIICCILSQGLRQYTICHLHRRLYVARPHITEGMSCYCESYVHKSLCLCVCVCVSVYVCVCVCASSHITQRHDLFWASARVCKTTHHIVYDLLPASACVCYESTHHREYEYDLLQASASVYWDTTHHKG